tara:strand:+ start:795 stop:1415 length:621 start_codon:yes stop_codon:yes gene_type:complete
MKKAAMFGLDARIALAIFGALSVISGAALYSAISNAKATALLTEMREVGKAWEAYLLDTGSNLPQRDSSVNTDYKFYTLQIENLIENAASVANWNGPYISYSKDDTYRLDGANGTFVYALTLNDASTWGDGTTTSWSPAGHCSAGNNCFLWISFNKIDSKETLQKIDELVDGSVDGDAGSFRWYYENATFKHNALLKIAPVTNPLG